MEDLNKFTDQELCDWWRTMTTEARRLRSELEDRGYDMQWKTGRHANWAKSGGRVKDQAPTDYRFTKTEVQILA